MKTVGNDDKVWDFPCGPVVNTSPSNTGGAVSIPGHRAKILHALQPKSQNIKQKQYYNKFNKDFKTGPHKKKNKKACTWIYKFIFTSREWGGKACLATGSGMGAWSAKSMKCQQDKKYQQEHWSRVQHWETSFSHGQQPSRRLVKLWCKDWTLIRCPTLGNILIPWTAALEAVSKIVMQRLRHREAR